MARRTAVHPEAQVGRPRDGLDRGAELGVSGYLHKDELADLLAAGDEGATAFLDRLESAVTT